MYSVNSFDGFYLIQQIKFSINGSRSHKKRARTFGRGTVRRGTVHRKKNVSFG